VMDDPWLELGRGRRCNRRPRLLYCHNSKLVAISQMAEYPQIGVRVDDDLLKRLDDWRRKQEDVPTRPEAIRRLMELGLKVKSSK